MNLFKTRNSNKKHVGEIVYLKENYRTNEKTAYDGIPTIYYDIYKNFDDVKVGKIELRLSVEGFMYYYGHIGYHVYSMYRGNNYAYYACKILFDIAKNEFNMNELLLTCSPENKASYHILEKLNGKYTETVDVPKNHTLYHINEKTKCIFKFII